MGNFLYVISLVPPRSPRVSFSRTSRFIPATSELTVAVFKITCVFENSLATSFLQMNQINKDGKNYNLSVKYKCAYNHIAQRELGDQHLRALFWRQNDAAALIVLRIKSLQTACSSSEPILVSLSLKKIYFAPEGSTLLSFNILPSKKNKGRTELHCTERELYTLFL